MSACVMTCVLRVSFLGYDGLAVVIVLLLAASLFYKTVIDKM